MEKKTNAKSALKKFEAVIEVVVERRKLNFPTEKPSVMHTKHEYTKSQGRKFRENETT